MPISVCPLSWCHPQEEGHKQKIIQGFCILEKQPLSLQSSSIVWENTFWLYKKWLVQRIRINQVKDRSVVLHLLTDKIVNGLSQKRASLLLTGDRLTGDLQFHALERCGYIKRKYQDKNWEALFLWHSSALILSSLLKIIVKNQINKTVIACWHFKIRRRSPQ